MRNSRVSQSKIGVLLDRFLIHRQRVFELALPQVVSAAQEKIIGLWIYGGLSPDDPFFLRRKRYFQRLRNAQRDLLLNREDIFHVAVVAFGPHGMAGGALD